MIKEKIIEHSACRRLNDFLHLPFSLPITG